MGISDTIVVIPAYNPDDKFLTLVEQLLESGFENIICVNDGSATDDKFIEAMQLGAQVLTHSENRGKGAALKTAFLYLKEKEISGGQVVTVDADGQHSIKAITDCINAAPEWGNYILLGARKIKMTGEKVPLRSRIGNVMTRFVTKVFCGINVTDTQTGLRVFPITLLPFMIDIKGNRYEYEMNMLLRARDAGIQLIEIPIEIVYEEQNKSSHFRPILDSVIIYKVIIKYMLASGLSVILDYLAFIVLSYMTDNIWISTYLARALSSVFNFIANKKVVFKSKGNTVRQMILYYMLVIVSATISAAGVYGFKQLFDGNYVISKVIVDTILFFLNYIIQREVIFRCKKKEG